MPNLKSAKKRMKTDAVKRKRNISVKSAMRTSVRATKEAVAANDKTAASEALNVSFSRLDRAAKKGLIHENKANRTKAQLAKMVETLA